MPHDPPAGRLTLHVLDTVRGGPAAGLPVSLFRVHTASRTLLGAWQTNADGRLDGPALAGAALRPGLYELDFDVGHWRGDAPGFYEVIPIRFRIDDASAHYHVPLLLSPFGYSTYRGS
jgi:5-hydroxyisourate hydrolase